jgi:hypothetical protein
MRKKGFAIDSQQPSAAWRSPKAGKIRLSGIDHDDKNSLSKAMGKIAAWAVDRNMTLDDVCDQLRTSMVLAALDKYRGARHGGAKP